MVKRVTTPVNSHGVSRHYTMFEWTMCEKCSHEFRRENGWKFKWFGVKQMYFCQTCMGSGIYYVNTYIDYMYDLYRHNMKPSQPPSTS